MWEKFDKIITEGAFAIIILEILAVIYTFYRIYFNIISISLSY